MIISFGLWCSRKTLSSSMGEKRSSASSLRRWVTMYCLASTSPSIRTKQVRATLSNSLERLMGFTPRSQATQLGQLPLPPTTPHRRLQRSAPLEPRLRLVALLSGLAPRLLLNGLALKATTEDRNEVATSAVARRVQERADDRTQEDHRKLVRSSAATGPKGKTDRCVRSRLAQTTVARKRRFQRGGPQRDLEI